MAKNKERIDKLLVEKELVPTRARGQALILAGEVLVDGQRIDKPGTAVSRNAKIVLKTRMPYVGRGGFKLAEALQAFALNVDGRVCADVGACTGGFTDVLLQNGAARVYAIDVGYGQLAWKLRQDKRVTVMERTNARYLNELPDPITFVCIDVSFISLRLILPAVSKWTIPGADVVALIKPQFEAGPKQVGKGGIVKETAVHRQVIREIATWSQNNNYAFQDLIQSPITGTDGNVEFLIWLKANTEGYTNKEQLEAKIARVCPAPK